MASKMGDVQGREHQMTRDPSYDVESPGLLWDLAYAWSTLIGLLRALVRRHRKQDSGYEPFAVDPGQDTRTGG